MQKHEQCVSLHLQMDLISVHMGKLHLRRSRVIKITLECQIGLISFVDWKPNNALLSFFLRLPLSLFVTENIC